MTGPRPPSPLKGRPLSLKAYGAAAGLIAPLARPLLEARARRGKEDPERLEERLGHASAARPAGPLAWIHAVSVGESVSALPLIARLAAERPDLALLVTSGTRASAEIMARRLPPGATHQYAPVDTPGAVARFLAHWRPDVGLFVESELWPNLILAARAAGARLALISARMTEKSARAWRARPSAVGSMLKSFDLILAQDGGTAARIAGFGGEVDGRLNLKRVGEPLGADAAEVARLKGMIGERRVVVAVSTHSPEEALVVRAVAAADAEALTIVVPRHPQLGDQVAHNLAGWRIARRSAGEPIGADTDVYLADTLNELGLSLRLADVAVVGKSFGPEVGGHNPLEPARLGVGSISGPAVENFAEVYDEMAAAGAALIAEGEGELAAMLAALIDEPDRLAALGDAARAYAAAQGDQLAAALDRIRPLLPAA
ncbi:MAG TPA: glycosyltransferase N-terminal domain-containing protein [Caulobacteraceae bacterium]|jgi:3-deoxy-D-manno-octulosonic-acid transferase